MLWENLFCERNTRINKCFYIYPRLQIIHFFRTSILFSHVFPFTFFLVLIKFCSFEMKELTASFLK